VYVQFYGRRTVGSFSILWFCPSSVRPYVADWSVGPVGRERSRAKMRAPCHWLRLVHVEGLVVLWLVLSVRLLCGLGQYRGLGTFCLPVYARQHYYVPSAELGPFKPNEALCAIRLQSVWTAKSAHPLATAHRTTPGQGTMGHLLVSYIV
jgi:hypothetical protein